jgi:hypothetical protein
MQNSKFEGREIAYITANMGKLFVTLFAWDLKATLTKTASGISARTLLFTFDLLP